MLVYKVENILRKEAIFKTLGFFKRQNFLTNIFLPSMEKKIITLSISFQILFFFVGIEFQEGLMTQD